MPSDAVPSDTERNDAGRDELTDATRAEEEREAHVTANPGRPATEDEERAAERHRGVDESVARHEREMLERGAHVKGEGQVE
jgi:hypothetical protein